MAPRHLARHGSWISAISTQWLCDPRDTELAAAITLTVVEPVSNGIGGDLFAYYFPGSALLPANIIDQVTLEQPADTIDIGSPATGFPEMDGHDLFLPLLQANPNMTTELLRQLNTVYFTVSSACLPDVPSSWFASGQKSGATILRRVWSAATGDCSRTRSAIITVGSPGSVPST